MSEGNEKVQISIRVPANVLASFDKIAKAMERDRTWVMNEAFSDYLKGEGGYLLMEIDGIAAAEAGDVVSFASVMEQAQAIIDRAERRQAGKAA